jgi:proton glutamate symport protein
MPRHQVTTMIAGSYLRAQVRRIGAAETGRPRRVGVARGLRRLSLPVWILIGAVAGIVTGVVFGEYSRVLEPVGKAYTNLLTMCVYPYLLCSLAHGLGRLDPATARRFAKRSWFVYLGAWSVVIVAFMLVAAAFPMSSPRAAITPETRSQAVDLVSLLIPGNPFRDLSGNVVPAVVVFAVLYGVALQHIKRKDALLRILEQFKDASVTIWGWIVMVAPVGVFALFASSAGTTAGQGLGKLMQYILLSLVSSSVIAFWLLPAVLSAVADVRHGELVRELREALVLSLVTTLSVVALPFIQQMAKRLTEKAGVSDEHLPGIIETNVSLAYPFAQLGNLGVIVFFSFCSAYFQAPLTMLGRLLLPFLSLLSTIGSPSSVVNAVAFLAAVYHVPPGTDTLYAATMTFTRYGQVALSVVGFAFVTLLATLSFYGKLRVRPVRLVVTLLATFAVLGGAIRLLRTLEPSFFERPPAAYLNYELDPELARSVKAVVFRTPAGAPPRTLAREARGLDFIHGTGVLRVGYDPAVIPFCYFNAKGNLVGYDVSYMYRLAAELNVRLEFVPSTVQHLTAELRAGAYDLAAYGIFVTAQRLNDLSVSRPYLQTPFALLARNEVAERLTTREQVDAGTDLRVACLNGPALLSIARTVFPGNHIEIVGDYERLLGATDLDVAPWTFAHAKAFALAHPGFTAVVPEGVGSPILIAYMMPPGSDQLSRYLESWIELKKADGFQAAQYAYWIEGLPRSQRQHRWCVIRNVLHWVNDDPRELSLPATAR